MQENRRVLILYASGGMGHVKEAEALEGAFAARHPEITVRNINVLDFANRPFRHIYEDGYNFISAYAIGIWRWMYHRYDVKKRHGLLMNLSSAAMDDSLRKFLDQYRPDYIIGTHPMPVRMLTHHPWPASHPVPLAIVVTDYGCHSYWVDKKIHRFFVAADEVRSSIVGMGILADHITVSGIPIDSKYSRFVDRAAKQAELGLDPNIPTILVIGGLVSETYLRELVVGLRQHLPVQFLIVTGRDWQLQRRLRRSTVRRDAGVKIFGFVDNLQELFGVADLVVTKAGGMTVSESLAKGVPLVIPSAIPGQEDDNLAFLIRYGVAVYAKGIDEMVGVLARMLRQPQTIAHMKERCQKLGRPNAATDIVETIAHDLEKL